MRETQFIFEDDDGNVFEDPIGIDVLSEIGINAIWGVGGGSINIDKIWGVGGVSIDLDLG